MKRELLKKGKCGATAACMQWGRAGAGLQPGPPPGALNERESGSTEVKSERAAQEKHKRGGWRLVMHYLRVGKWVGGYQSQAALTGAQAAISPGGVCAGHLPQQQGLRWEVGWGPHAGTWPPGLGALGWSGVGVGRPGRATHRPLLRSQGPQHLRLQLLAREAHAAGLGHDDLHGWAGQCADMCSWWRARDGLPWGWLQL